MTEQSEMQTTNDAASERPLLLIVDDFDEYRDAVKLYMEASGYRVVEADDGHLAVEIARATLPAAILMDVGLPKWGGIAAVRDIRADAKLRTCPIIVVTAYGTTGLIQEALDAGCDEVMTKPVDFEHLIAVIERLRGKNKDALAIDAR